MPTATQLAAHLPPMASMPEDAPASPVAASALPPLASMPDAAPAALPAAVLPDLQPPPAPIPVTAPPTDFGVPAALAPAPAALSVAPPDPVMLHAAAPNADELAQFAVGSGRGFEALAQSQDRANAMQAHAIDAQAKVQVAQADAQRKVLEAQQADAQKLADAQAARNDAAAKAMAGAAAEVDKASAAAAATPFDPDHYRKSMNIGQHVSTAIGLILGGIGSGITGGPNLAAQMLQKRIDADIDGQKMNYEKARNTVADRRTSYAMLRDAGLTDQQAQLGARQALASKYQGQLAMIGAQYAGPAINANRQMLQAQLGQTHAKAQADMMQDVTRTAYQNWDRRVQLQAMQDSALGAATHVPNDPAATHQREMEQLTIPGLGGHAKTPEEHQKAVIIEQTYRKLIPMLDEMRQMREQHGRNLLPYSPEVAARAANLANSVHLLGKDLFQLGVLSDSDNKLLDKVFPANPLATFTLDSTVLGQIAQFQKNATEARRSQLQTMGFEIHAPGHDVLDAPAGEKPEA